VQVLGRRLRVTTVFTWALWTVEFVIALVSWVTTRPTTWSALAIGGGLSSLVGIALCFGMDRALRALERRSAATRMLAALVLCAIASVLWSAAYFALQRLVGLEPKHPSPLSLRILMMTLDMISVFVAWAAVWFAATFSERLARQELQLTQSRLAAADAQNQMLRYQLNPHFLFNTLSAVSTLVAEKRSVQAEQMLLNLCGFLRMSLQHAPADKIPIRDEIALEDAYLAIERERFEDRLTVNLNVDPHAEDCLAPNLILQPLVENAIKYGVGATRGPVNVTLDVTAADGQVRLRVRDDGDARTADGHPSSGGVGLSNVRHRLAVLYGSRAKFSAGPLEPAGFEAIVEIPMERAPC
jgi:LytS/YehU family sensor histidine kinase